MANSALKMQTEWKQRIKNADGMVNSTLKMQTEWQTVYQKCRWNGKQRIKNADRMGNSADQVQTALSKFCLALFSLQD